MLAPVTRQFKDLSTPDSFAFLFHCDRCGKEWRSDTYKFNTRNFESPLDETVRGMLWNQQHEEAYERANREAGIRFNRCPCCGCRICDDCLYLASSGECKDCADKNLTWE